jgi:hypothetical protein
VSIYAWEPSISLSGPSRVFARYNPNRYHRACNISVIPCVVKSERFPAMCRRACRRSQVAVKLWETPTGVPPTIGETGDRWNGGLTLNKMELSRLTHKRSSLDNGAPPRRDL